MNLKLLLENLDEDQRTAVTAPMNRPVCVRANAGSGKTRTLTSRIAYLAINNVKGAMLLTFTNKAAKEMTARVNKLLKGKSTMAILSGTFHHVACIYLRKYSYLLGIPNNFSIAANSDSTAIADRIKKSVLADIPKGEIPVNFPSASQIVKMYSYYRNAIKGLSFDEYMNNLNILPKKRAILRKIIEGYEDYKKDAAIYDFDDLILQFRKLLLKYPKIKIAIHHMYPMIHCDEVQDINYIQYDLLNLLDVDKNLYVCGDEAQSIYNFRGSKIQYILSFAENYKNALVLTLRYNYRSDGGIVSLAENAVNEGVTNKTEKKVMLAFLPKKIVPKVIGFLDEYEQALFIAENIINNKYKLSETAVLVRNNFIMRDIEFAFRRAHINYKIVGGIPFYERVHIKDILAFMMFKLNCKNKIAFIRVITMARGVGSKTAEKIYNAFEVLNFDYSKICELKLPAKSRSDVLKILDILHRIDSISEPSNKFRFIYEEYYEEYLKGCYEDEYDFSKRENDIYKFIDSSSTYEKADAFIEDLMLENSKEDSESDAVIISSIHRAKGLEYSNIYLPYLNENILPAKKSALTKEGLAEELRVFYVAITRAKSNLTISYISALEDDPNENLQYASRFIQSLDKTLFIAK